MPLRCVTVTGVDDRTDLSWLEDYSEEFPFVEWGVLISHKMGKSRYPKAQTIENLLNRKRRNNMKLSLHICGSWMREVIEGLPNLPTRLTDGFDRIQLNIGDSLSIQYRLDPLGFAKNLHLLSLDGSRPVIVPVDEQSGNVYVREAYEAAAASDYKFSIQGLTDASGGRGVLPDRWPAPYFRDFHPDYKYHGYAGGLTVENLADQLPRIEQASCGADYWIDVESGVRTADFFGVGRVREFLKIAAAYMADCRSNL